MARLGKVKTTTANMMQRIQQGQRRKSRIFGDTCSGSRDETDRLGVSRPESVLQFLGNLEKKARISKTFDSFCSYISKNLESLLWFKKISEINCAGKISGYSKFAHRSVSLE